jgi:flagellar hook-length control protein FliK
MNLAALAPVTSASAPAPTPSTPAKSSDEPGASGFSQCLDHAIEGHAGEDTAAPDKAQDTPVKRPPARTRAAGPRERNRIAADAKGDVKCDAKIAAVATQGDATAAHNSADKPQDAAPTTPDIATLLPGWAPTPSARTQVASNNVTADATPTLHVDSSARASAAAIAALPRDADAGTTAVVAAPTRSEITTALIDNVAAPIHAAALHARESEPALALPAPLPPLTAPSTTSTNTNTATTAHVAAPLDTPAFAPALATQVRWLVQDGVQQAQLTLNPAEMGPVAVQIVIDGRDARIDFSADFAATRTALEASLPVLAAALDDSGLRLAGGGVHDGRQGPRQGGQPAWRGATRGAAAHEIEAPALPGVRALSAGNARGLVDLLA